MGSWFDRSLFLLSPYTAFPTLLLQLESTLSRIPSGQKMSKRTIEDKVLKKLSLYRDQPRFQGLSSRSERGGREYEKPWERGYLVTICPGLAAGNSLKWTFF